MHGEDHIVSGDQADTDDGGAYENEEDEPVAMIEGSPSGLVMIPTPDCQCSLLFCCVSVQYV